MSHNPLPVVAIIGRPNVGKSTLFNRLTRTRHALVANVPGVTRDRREGEVKLDGLRFTLLDTAGLEEAEADSLSARMTEQTLSGIQQADVIIMLVDGRSSILPSDAHFAGLVRQSGKPVILAVNKAEGKGGTLGAIDAYRLGLGDPIAISAEHGEGIAALYDALLPLLPDPSRQLDAITEEQQADEIIQIAVVGRPNVGKSTFINVLLGEDRLLTGPEAGITRDAIAIPFDYQGHTLKLVDTAGMRKKSKVMPHMLEVMSVNDTRHAIQYAHVVVLMLDATQALEKQDNTIAGLLAKEGRACVLALNKWDLVEDKQAVMDEVLHQVNLVMPGFRGLPVVHLSATRKKGVPQVLDAALKAYEVWNKRVSTGELNRWLEMALEQHTPPLIGGRRLKIKYITQAKSRPPTFALFVNHKEGVPMHYQRYLMNSLREHFDLPGTPIRLLIRRKKNPYDTNAD